jgi:hypothetical protein
VTSGAARAVEPIARVGLWGLALLLAVRFVAFAAESSVQPSSGFGSCYTVAVLASQRQDVARAYNDAWFGARVQELVPGVFDVFAPNPPTRVLLCAPFAVFDYVTARVLWTILSLAIVTAAVGWLAWETRLGGAWLAGAIVFVLLYQPLWANTRYAQAYALLLGLLVVAWSAYLRGRERLLGLGLAGLVVVKLAMPFLWLLILAQRRLAALGWALFAVALACLASLLLLGVDTWLAFLGRLADVHASASLAVTAYQTQMGLLRHLFTRDAQWNPAPLLEAPALAVGLGALSIVVAVGLTVYRSVNVTRSAPAFAAFVVLGVVFNAKAVDYHYLLLLVPIALLVAQVRAQVASWPWLVLGAAMTLIAVDLPYRSPRLADGVWALLAYPKLYGAWLLWGLAVWACRPAAVAAPLRVEAR